MTNIAKLFTNGRSQAVRLPAAYRFSSTTQVFIRKDPKTGDVILSQKPSTWDEFFSALEGAEVSPTFLSAEERQLESMGHDPFDGWSE